MARTTRTTEHAPTRPDRTARAPASAAVVAAAGQFGIKPDGTVVDGVAEQTAQALANVLPVLDGSGRARDRRHQRAGVPHRRSQFEAMNEVYETFFSEPRPARTTVYVGLPAGLLVEIDALAVIERDGMRLLRVGPLGAERPAVLVDDEVRRRLRPRRRLRRRVLRRRRARHGCAHSLDAQARRPAARRPADVRVGAPIAAPGKVVCIGLNYADHAAESGAPLPTEPILFMKSPSHGGRAVRRRADPADQPKTDYEVELGDRHRRRGALSRRRTRTRRP